MPSVTITTTPTEPSTFIPLKVTSTDSPHSLSSSSTTAAATLRTLYTRAARAFLHRDIPLTHTLIVSAFALLPPPAHPHDTALSVHRRKWDVLRITTEVTVYTSPPGDSAGMPAALRTNAMLSGSALVQSMHARSLALFTPRGARDAAYVPAELAVTLALASIKVDAPLVGRALVEDWLARRGQWQEPQGVEGYEKVLDVFCLSILPLLEEWDYAREFLQYETELPVRSRDRLVATLSSLHTERQAAIAAAAVQPSITTPASPSPSSPLSSSSQATPTPSRPSSPTPSTSSSSTSTRTAVPATQKLNKFASSHSLTPLAPSPSSSSVLSYTASSTTTSRTVTPRPGTRRPPPKFRSPSRSPDLPGSGPSALTSTAVSGGVTSSNAPVTAFTLLRATLRPYIDRAPRVTVFFLLCVLVPLVSFVVRLRRKPTAGVSAAAGPASDVRRRLGGVKQAGLLKGIWDETVRAVRDTVVMGGRGLV